jgi:adenine deaminase
LLEADVEGDILKVAVIERTSDPGKMFVGFVKGFKMRKGAFASSVTWDLSGIVVVGTNDEDMAGAVNRVLALQGGAVVYAEGEVLAELPLPVGGCVSDLPIEVLYQRYQEVQQKVVELGTSLPDAHFTLTALTTVAIPFFRICEAGLMDIREGKVVGLLVS